jgi:hypothetical protein
MAKGIIGGTQLMGGLFGAATNKRPKYKTPGAATGALAIAQEQANRMEMPGESTMYGKIDQQGANMLEAAREYGMAGLASLPAIQAKMQGSKLDVGMQAAKWRDQKQAALQQALGTYAGYQDQEFQMNEFAPFKDKQQRSQNAIGAGAQNLIGGIDTYSMLSLLNPEAGASPAPTANTAFGGLPGHGFADIFKGMTPEMLSGGKGPSKWQSMLSIFKPK